MDKELEAIMFLLHVLFLLMELSMLLAPLDEFRLASITLDIYDSVTCPMFWVGWLI
jgi:hypothetical protein